MADMEDVKPSTPRKTKSSSHTALVSARSSPSTSPRKAKPAAAWSPEEDYIIMTYLAARGVKQLSAEQREELASILGRTERGVRDRLKKTRDDLASMTTLFSAKNNSQAHDYDD